MMIAILWSSTLISIGALASIQAPVKSPPMEFFVDLNFTGTPSIQGLTREILNKDLTQAIEQIRINNPNMVLPKYLSFKVKAKIHRKDAGLLIRWWLQVGVGNYYYPSEREVEKKGFIEGWDGLAFTIRQQLFSTLTSFFYQTKIDSSKDIAFLPRPPLNKIISQPYPSELNSALLKTRYHGVVTSEVVIDQDGQVVDVVCLEGPEVYRPLVIKHLRSSKFNSGSQGFHVVIVRYLIPNGQIEDCDGCLNVFIRPAVE